MFAFHPIHLMLNTPNVDWYLAHRDRFREGTPLGELRYQGRGAADYYSDLVERIRVAGVESVSLASALEQRARSRRSTRMPPPSRPRSAGEP